MAMRPNIAKARAVAGPAVNPWAAESRKRREQARQPNGSVCPVCLRFGPQSCKQHKSEAS
jgi:hypothetical protein